MYENASDPYKVFTHWIDRYNDKLVSYIPSMPDTMDIKPAHLLTSLLLLSSLASAKNKKNKKKR